MANPVEQQSLVNYYEFQRLRDRKSSAENETSKLDSERNKGGWNASTTFISYIFGMSAFSKRWGDPLIKAINFIHDSLDAWHARNTSRDRLEAITNEYEVFLKQHPEFDSRPKASGPSIASVESPPPSETASAKDKVSTDVPMANAFSKAITSGAPAGAPVVHNTTPGNTTLAAAPAALENRLP